MISDLQIPEIKSIQVAATFVGVPVRYPLTFLDRPRIPWRFNGISSINTSGAAIMLTSIVFYDENNSQIFIFGLIPWQFANETVLANAISGPDVPIAGLFTPNISGVNRDFFVLPEWSFEITALNNLPGSSYDASVIFSFEDSDD